MADQLCTSEDLASALQMDLDLSTATLLIELATAKVQRAAGGQRIIEVTDTAVIDVGPYDDDQYLALPQLPVQSVSAVVLNGTAVADWTLSSQMLFRVTGWNALWTRPSQVKATYTHGYPEGSQWLQLARDHTLALAKLGYGNPSGATTEALDDYRVSYAEADARMQMTEPMRRSIADAYGTSTYVTCSR